MSVPSPPQDFQLSSIIEKLAQYVAKNGKEFEQKTISMNQMNNNKFSFLHAGDPYHEYYQYRLMENRRNNMISENFQQQIHPQVNNPCNKSPWSNNNNGSSSQKQQHPNSNIITQIESINVEQQKLRQQIIESEKNLQAQHQVLMEQQKSQIDKTLEKAQTEHIMRCAQENFINLKELDDTLQPIIDSCTKDSIANGKASILQQATNSTKRQIISQYILKKALSSTAVFSHKLHLIYLINDLLHHCVKKNDEDLKNSLEDVVIPMFCNATINATEEQKDKLSKLLTLWSTKANFFDSCALTKLQSPPSSLQEYHDRLLSQYAAILAPLTQTSNATFEHYKQQHQAFIQHATSQISVLDNQRQILEQQLIQQPQSSSLLHHPPDLIQNPSSMLPSSTTISIIQQQPPPSTQGSNSHQYFNLPPPNFSIPDFSKPPPGFDNMITSSSQQDQPPPVASIEVEVDLKPTLPFFELPAGLMVPLIRLEDHKYCSIDPDELSLPPPNPPSERLINALEAFYAAPSHERPRDNEGWEKLGLYEYFKMKNGVKKQRDDELMRGERKPSKSPSPIPDIFTKPVKKIKKRIYRSKSPEKKSMSRSPSPLPPPSKIRQQQQKRKSRSPSPVHRGFNRGENFRNERNRKRSISPPPSFATSTSANRPVDEGNKGHQLLKKLGWQSGGGLGAGNQGITQPILVGEVRDKTDLYKGIGMNKDDPYENFRKNRSNNFIIRMKTRDAEKN